MKPHRALPILLAALAGAAAAQTAPDLPATAATTTDAGEPRVRQTVIEDRGSKIEETQVRSHTQRIVVTPKVGTTKSYEIIPDSSGRAMYDGSGASKTHTACSGFTSARARLSIATMPWIAPVGTPPGPRRSGSAW